MCSHFENYFLPQPKNWHNRTTVLYITLSTYKTPKTISRKNQKTNTTPQLYCTLSTQVVCKTKTCSHQNQKLTQQHHWKKFLQPTRSKCIPLSVCNSVCQYRLKEGCRVKECSPGGTVGYPAQPGLIRLSVCDSNHQKGLREGYSVKEC